jgi:hypothetical protein
MRLAAIHSLTDNPATATSPSAKPGVIGRLLAFVRGRLARRAVLAELHGLDERTLDDLRLYPGDFQAIADGTYIREGGAHDVARKPTERPANSARPAPPYR